MAVEVNARKRKHKHISSNEEYIDAAAAAAVDEGDRDEMVPKKIAKKIKSSKKHKQYKTEKHTANDEAHTNDVDVNEQLNSNDLEQKNADGDNVAEEMDATNNEPEDANHDSGFEEKNNKFSKDFKMLNFRAKLRGTNFITELRHFLHLAQSRPQIVAKYIEKRGKPLELAEALERIDKSNILHVAYVCQALQLVVMEILSDGDKAQKLSAECALRYFLKSHGSVVEDLLKSHQLQHRRIALKLLTAIVCIEPQLGRQLLNSYDILSNVKMIENFLSHSTHEINDEDTVRKCFIHFVLAYLIDGNTLLIRNMLDRGAVIRALASGLLYDDHVTVCVVLSTLRKYVLECSEISKTKKLHVFDLMCCKSFVRLYDWLGPKVYAMKFKGKNKHGSTGETFMPQNQVQELVKNERDAVAEEVHEFLLMLLTSRKYGITFDAVTHFRQRHNAVQGKIIGFVFKPWCNKYKTDLIVKILQACPELSRHTVRNFAGCINPLRTASGDLVPAFDFLAQIISAAHPKLLHNAMNKITLTDFSYWIKDICLPIETLTIIVGSRLLLYKTFDVRLAVNRLLLAMFTQYANYMAAITRREQSKSGENSLRRFKFDILNHLLVNYPPVEHILSSLYMTICQPQQRDVLAHLDVALDLVLIICKANRTLIDKTSTILNYLELLRPLYATDATVTDAMTPSGSGFGGGNIQLELKTIKTILLLLPAALKPGQKHFRSVFMSCIKAFIHGSIEIRTEAGDLLRSMFWNTGIFESAELEIDLWLQPLRFFDDKTVNAVIETLNEVLQVTKVEVDTPKTIESIRNEKNVQKLFEHIEKGLSVQAHIETVSISKLMLLIFKGIEIVEPLNRYLECVCLLMYHYYPRPEYVLTLYEMQFESIQKYMKSWLAADNKEGLALKGIPLADIIPHLNDVQNAILQGTTTFEDIFTGVSNATAGVELEFDGKLMKFSEIAQNEKMLMIYVELVLFLVAQLVEKEKLDRAHAKRAAEFIVWCLRTVQAFEQKAAGAEGDATEPRQFLGTLLKYIFGVRLSYIRNAEIFNTNADTQLNYIHFLHELTENCNDMIDFDSHATNFRLKIIKSVAISLESLEETKRQSDQLSESIKLVAAFRLDANNCVEILELLATRLKYSDFFVSDTGFQQKSIYYELLICILERLAALKKSIKCDVFVRKFVKFYTHMIKKSTVDINLETLEESFHNFLLISHQCIPELDVKFFDTFFVERKLNKSTIRLACLLLERDEKLHDAFIRHLPSNIGKKELIYPLLKIIFHKEVQLDPAVLQNIYQEYKNGFMKTIEKPQKAGVIYKENVDCSIDLIQACMPKSECVDFCNKNFKFDTIETYQIQIIHAIYQKAFASLEAEAFKQKSTIFVNFINLQVQMLSIDLKKQTLDMERMEQFSYFLWNWWQQHELNGGLGFEPDFSKILKGQQWLNFCKSCLKLGMHINEAELEPQQADERQGLLLKMLAFLCNQLYTDFNSEDETMQEPAEPAQLFEMICSHSKFYDIVLKIRPTNMKTQVLHLLYTLAKKSPSALAETQIPFILGAYQAKLTDSDRYALALLQLYEHYDCGLQEYRPFIWGESAVAFYALRAADEERADVTRQETSIAQVMSLIDKQICEYTIDNFPIWRKLNSSQQMPLLEFHNPALRACSFGSNSLERRIELAVTQFAENDLRLCPKRDGLYEQCYDPAFFVPLMNMCFAPEAYAHPARPVQNGLLSLVFAALSSRDKDMRLAAGCAQLRYRAHFENNKFFERPLWIQAYENIQAGLSDLRDSWTKHKKNSGTPRVPLISGLFVARTFNLTTDPTHLLYKQLTMYLRLKSSFNFQCVPEFNVLFYSPEIEHHSFRQFIVEVIRDGIKSSSDLFLLVTTNTFKVLMGFYGSPISTLDINLLILSVFSTCVKIPASTKIMIENVGILPWLNTIISSVEFYQFDVIEGLISVLNNLWYAMKANAGEFHNFVYLEGEIHRLILSLLPHLSPRISVGAFAKLMNILQKTAAGTSRHLALSSTQLDQIIGCAQKHYPKLVYTIESIRSHGGVGAISHENYCRQLHNDAVERTAILAVSSLRSYVINWWKCHNPKADLANSSLEASVLNSNVE